MRSRRSSDCCSRARAASRAPRRSECRRCAAAMRCCTPSRSRSATGQFFTHARERALGVAHRAFLRLERAAQLFQALLALDHAGVRVAAAHDAKPLAAHPFAARRHQRLPFSQRPAAGQRVGEASPRYRRRERRSSTAAGPRTCAASAGEGAAAAASPPRFDQHDVAAVEARRARAARLRAHRHRPLRGSRRARLPPRAPSPRRR